MAWHTDMALNSHLVTMRDDASGETRLSVRRRRRRGRRRSLNVVANKGAASIFLLSFVFSSRRPSCLTPLFRRSSRFPGPPAGPPGCGKTLTAKAISKLLRKTLCVVTAGDLVITASEVKRNLEGVLDVCSTCDALVLVDEADMSLETPCWTWTGGPRSGGTSWSLSPPAPGIWRRTTRRFPRGGGRVSVALGVVGAPPFPSWWPSRLLVLGLAGAVLAPSGWWAHLPRPCGRGLISLALGVAFLLSFVFSSRRPSCLTPLFRRSSRVPGPLAGPPGCGKTLTAKAISKLLRKTLYVVTAGDLGITASEVKRNLEELLDVCSTCDAIVLVDEADMFLETPPLDVDGRAKV